MQWSSFLLLQCLFVILPLPPWKLGLGLVKRDGYMKASSYVEFFVIWVCYVDNILRTYTFYYYLDIFLVAPNMICHLWFSGSSLGMNDVGKRWISDNVNTFKCLFLHGIDLPGEGSLNILVSVGSSTHFFLNVTNLKNSLGFVSWFS